VVPGDYLVAPVSSAVGNRATETQRRELVFFITTKAWSPVYTVADEHGFGGFEPEDLSERMKPTDVITDVVEGITTIPKDIAEGIAGEEGGSERGSELGGEEQ
jgi:hypothetical protein